MALAFSLDWRRAPSSACRMLILAGSIAVIARAGQGGRPFPIRSQPHHVLLALAGALAQPV